MIIVLHGADEFRISERVKAVRLSVVPGDLSDINTTFLNAADCDLEELFLTASVVPFMAEQRLVIVRDFIKITGNRTSGSTRVSKDRSGLAGTVQALSELPATTLLVLLEGDIGRNNPLLRKLKGIATVEYFPMLSHTELIQWIKDKAQTLGVGIEDSASRLLASYIGSDLRVIDSEIMKLSLYKNFTFIEQSDIENFVSNSRQENIFKVVDACIGRKLKQALRSSNDLVQAGESPSSISRLIERQVKLLIRTKSLKESGVKVPEVSKRLSLFGYPLQKTLEQERLVSFGELSAMHDHILESEVRVRSGHMNEMSSLQMLITEIGTILR